MSDDLELYHAPSSKRSRSTAAQTAKNRQRAYQMRLVGYSYQQISEALGRTPDSCRRLVREAVAELPQDTREMQRSLVEDLLRGAMRHTIEDSLSPNPRVRDAARGRLLAFADRLIKLSGLDPASKVDVHVDKSQAEVDLERLLAEAGAQVAEDEQRMRASAEASEGEPPGSGPGGG